MSEAWAGFEATLTPHSQKPCAVHNLYNYKWQLWASFSAVSYGKAASALGD